MSSSICLKKPYCSDFVLARTKLEQNPEHLIKSLFLNKYMVFPDVLILIGK